jgi:hypothetical protein
VNLAAHLHVVESCNVPFVYVLMLGTCYACQDNQLVAVAPIYESKEPCCERLCGVLVLDKINICVDLLCARSDTAVDRFMLRHIADFWRCH